MNSRDFDKEAAAWDLNPVRAKLAEDVATAMAAHCALTSDSDVLDFGCGTGLVSLRFAPRVRSLTGADSSVGMLGVFQSKAERLGLSNVHTLAVPTESPQTLGGPYDLIVSSMALHHVRDVPALLRLCYRSLHPAGCLCLADLDLEDGEFHGDNAEGVYHNGVDRLALRAMLETAGFPNIADTTAAAVVTPVRSGSLRRFTVFLMSAHR